MHGKSRVSSVIKYDCFNLDDSGLWELYNQKDMAALYLI